MKKLMSYLMCTSLVVVALSFTSCQEEFEELPGQDNQEAIKASSSTAKLIERTASKDGSYDNIVDGASCFAINFPYVVNVNGLEVNIDGIEDLKVVKQLFDEVEIDDDILEIIFPISITLADYSVLEIGDEEKLEELAEGCLEGGDDDDIECIDFVYPLVVYSFNVNLQQTGNVTIGNDMELRRYFNELDDDDLISFDFPIALELYDGIKTTVSNNAELANAIETAKSECDEDDDDDYHDDDFTQERLEEYLVDCPWLVKEVLRDNQDNTEQFLDYVMNFTADGKVVMKDRLGTNLAGSWSTKIEDHNVLLKLEFDALVHFDLEWSVYDLDNGKIKLYAGDGERVIMKKGCDIVDHTPDTLRETLMACSWIIKKVEYDDEDVDRLLGYEFKFMAEGGVSLSNGTTISQGNWEIKTNAQGRLVMAITIGNEPGVSFEWLLSDLREKRLKFAIEDSGYELILEKVCENNADDDDVPGIRDIVKASEWLIAKYMEGDNDETVNFSGFTFAFQAELVAQVTTGETGPTYPGLWRVIRDSEGGLKFYLNFGLETALQDVMEDWKIVSITNDRIELKNTNDDDSMEILVFEKK